MSRFEQRFLFTVSRNKLLEFPHGIAVRHFSNTVIPTARAAS